MVSEHKYVYCFFKGVSVCHCFSAKIVMFSHVFRGVMRDTVRRRMTSNGSTISLLLSRFGVLLFHCEDRIARGLVHRYYRQSPFKAFGDLCANRVRRSFDRVKGSPNLFL